jgi:hypothetical protein
MPDKTHCGRDVADRAGPPQGVRVESEAVMRRRWSLIAVVICALAAAVAGAWQMARMAQERTMTLADVEQRFGAPWFTVASVQLDDGTLILEDPLAFDYDDGERLALDEVVTSRTYLFCNNLIAASWLRIEHAAQLSFDPRFYEAQAVDFWRRPVAVRLDESEWIAVRTDAQGQVVETTSGRVEAVRFDFGASAP